MAAPVVLTKKDVQKMLQHYVNNFDTRAEAARAMGVSPQIMSNMLNDRIPLNPTALDVLGIGRASLYTTKPVQGKYLDGALSEDF